VHRAAVFVSPSATGRDFAEPSSASTVAGRLPPSPKAMADKMAGQGAKQNYKPLLPAIPFGGHLH